jgi:hypothetical protein
LSDVVSTNSNAETKKNKIDGNQRLCDTCVRTGSGLVNLGQQRPSAAAVTILYPESYFYPHFIVCRRFCSFFVASFA